MPAKQDFAFRAGIRNVRVVSPWQLIKKREAIWGTDPVHPLGECYQDIASTVRAAATELANKRPAADQGWAIALFGKERIALFFAKKSEKKSERAIRSFCALLLFLKRAKERFALLLFF